MRSARLQDSSFINGRTGVKSLGIPLDKPQQGHNGMTPYEQAMEALGISEADQSKYSALL